MIGAPIFRYVLTPGWAGDSLARAAQAVPSLDLNFAVTKNVGPLVTFTRASSATYVGSDGLIKTATTNEPRFDHNPTTTESLGLLVQEQRTNLLLQSNAFTTHWQSVANTLTSGSAISPDGTTNGWRFADTAANNTHNIFQSIAWTAVATTFTIYAKYDTHRWIGARIGAAGNQFFGSWDLQNGVVGSFTAGATIGMQAVGNGWYRLTLTATLTTAGTANVLVYLNNADSASALTYTGTATGSYIYGAQLEAGAFATSYIATTTAAATRAADVASITGSAFSSWYRQDEGSFLITGTAPSDAIGTFLSVDNNTADQRWQLRRSTTARARLRFVSTGNSLDLLSVNNVFSVGSLIQMAGSAIAGTQTIFVNGNNVINATATAMPTAIQLSIGSGPATDVSSQTIRRLTYWPQRLPNNTLEAITQ